MRGHGGEPRHGGRGGLDGHGDGGQGPPAVAQGLEGHAVGAVIAARHGNGRHRVDDTRVVHVGPGARQLVVQGVPGRHGLHSGERQAPRHLVLSGDDVLDGKGVLKGGRLGHPEVVAGHLRQVRPGGGQRAEPQLGLLLEVVGRLRLLALGQALRGHQHFEAFATSQETSVLKHVPATGVQRPKAPLTWLVGAPGDLDEAVVEGQVVSQGVLPALGVLPVVGEAVHDELVDLTQREHLLGAALDGHSRERDVGVRRFLVAVRVSSRARHPSKVQKKPIILR